MKRSKSLFLNMVFSLILEVVTIASGLIIPRLILAQYGSELNGLVQSITQFLSIITFLDLGIGSVVQSSLFKPLVEKDFDTISKIITSGEKFFKRILTILVVYVFVLACFYPFIAKQGFGWIFTATLVFCIGIGFFAQYYLGVVDRMFLAADQKGYIQYSIQILTIIVNVIACAVLIKTGAPIHVIRLTMSLVFLVRPLVLRIYINRHYKINRHSVYQGEPIKQKWNGIAQHVSAVVLNNTDNIVLTLFDSLESVSIYSVYYNVINGIEKLIQSSTNGIFALLGNLIAEDDKEKLTSFFSGVELLMHYGVSFIFCCAGILIVPFVRVYTAGITDANYIQPLFAALLVMAYAAHCFRLPYNIVILAGGHYKQTQSSYIFAAVINISISCFAVFMWGLVGVAIGTLVSMVFHTVWIAVYLSKNIVMWPFRRFLKICTIDIVSCILCVLATSHLTMDSVTYLSWVLLALKTAIICFLIISAVFLLAFPKRIATLSRLLIATIRKKG